MIFLLLGIFIYVILLLLISIIVLNNLPLSQKEQLPDFNTFPSLESTKEAEKRILNNSEPWQTRLDLVRAYFFQYSDIPEANLSAKNHVEWLVSNKPESQFYYAEWKSFFIGNNDDESRILEKWKTVLIKNKKNYTVIRNAGLFLTNIDNLTALACFQECLDANPLSPEALEDFVFLCDFFEDDKMKEKSILYKKKLDSINWSERHYKAVFKLKEKIGFLMPSFLIKPLLYSISIIPAGKK